MGANELGRRDYVTGEMWKNKPPFRLCLNKAASDEIIWHCKHYTGRGVMKFYESGAALASDMGIAVSFLEETHDAHYQAAKKTEKDPNGGSWPAYPSGKSWDDASGNSLLDCVVFGRVAAKAACKWMFGAQDEFRLCPIPKELKELTK